jgi:hypothetical protein
MTASDEGFQALIAKDPTLIPPAQWKFFEERYKVIAAFLHVTLGLFRQSLEKNCDPEIAGWFFRDVPPQAGPAFHLAISSDFYTIPLFFRTDEMGGGKIAEVQCPGSGWGEYCLLRWGYQQLFATPMADRIPDLATQFNRSLQSVVSDPIIHHMVDNASAIASNIYFINSTRRAPSPSSYWGFDPHIRPQDCNVIRTHQYLGLFSDNLIRLRMEKCRSQVLRYDHPLVCIFEQKLALALPFLRCTRDHYSDAIREIFPYTTLILPEGVTLENGSTLTLSAFSSLPPRDRLYVIKYAGMDPSRNWGSRAVYFANELSRIHLERLLEEIVAEHKAGGGCWILQAAVAEHGKTTGLSPLTGEIEMSGYRKYSAFYGPTGLLAMSNMLSSKKKVHGQVDTVFGVVAPSEQ